MIAHWRWFATHKTGCEHKVQIVRRRTYDGHTCTLRTLCVACEELFEHTFTGDDARSAKDAWFYVPGGLPLLGDVDEEGEQA